MPLRRSSSIAFISLSNYISFYYFFKIYYWLGAKEILFLYILPLHLYLSGSNGYLLLSCIKSETCRHEQILWSLVFVSVWLLFHAYFSVNEFCQSVVIMLCWNLLTAPFFSLHFGILLQTKHGKYFWPLYLIILIIYFGSWAIFFCLLFLIRFGFGFQITLMGFMFLVTSALLGYVSGGFFLIMFFNLVILCACLIVKWYFLGYNVDKKLFLHLILV